MVGQCAKPAEVLVAIGFAEALSAPEVLWSLIDAGFKVIAFSRRGHRAAIRHSRHVTIHEITPPEQDWAAALSDVAGVLARVRQSGNRCHVLLPLDDSAVWMCSRVLPRTGWILAGPGGVCADLALDKWKQIEMAAAAGFNVPATLLASTSEELSNCTTGFPVILRPSSASPLAGGRLRKGRNWICANEAELALARAAWNGSPPLLVQPFLEGTGEGVFGLATENGVVAWSAHRRLRMMNPHGSGSSACISAAVPESLKASVTAFVSSCGWRGMFMVELLRTDDGRPWFIEFNGRAWGSMALSRRQSLEYPAWTVKLALDPEVRCTYSANKKEGIVCRHVGREFMHLFFVLRGSHSEAIRRWPTPWETLARLLRPHRRSSFYNWRSEDWRVFVSDCWNTICDQLVKTN